MSLDDIQQTIKAETVLPQLLCRICATEHPDNCLNNLLTSIHNGLYFVDILQYCLQRSIARGNGLPLNICLDCTSKLIIVYDFCLMCNGSERKFCEMLDYRVDSDVLEEKKVEVNIDESEIDVKPQSYFIDCTAIDTLSTNCNETNDKDRVTEERIEPQTKPKLNKLGVQHYECFLCKTTFRRIDHLRKHTTSRHNTTNKFWSCMDCQKQFEKRNKLVEHFYKHVSTNCEHCPEAFTTLREMRKHYQQSHSDQLTTHQCDQCPKKFILKAQLRIHMHNHMDNHKKRYNCHVCSEMFSSQVQLKGHIRTLHTKCLCSECGKTFKNNSLLTSHQKVHKSEKPFVCPKCPSRFKWRVALTYHMTIHEQDRKHVCETCGMGFTTRTAMRGHAKIHSGEKPYACDKCSKRFLRRTHLKRHNLSHTGEKPHICKYCEKSFRQCAQLNKHLRLHVGENTYQCDLCPKKFKLKAEMKKHEYEHYENQDFAAGGTITNES